MHRVHQPSRAIVWRVAMLLVLGVVASAGSAAASLTDRGSFAVELTADDARDPGATMLVRHHAGAVRIEYGGSEGSEGVVILLLPNEGVMVYHDVAHGTQVLPIDALMADDDLYDSIAETFTIMLPPDAPMHPCVRMSVHDRVPTGFIPVWDCRIVGSEVVGGRPATRWSVQEVWGPGDAEPPHDVWIDDELGVPIEYRDGFGEGRLAFTSLEASPQDPGLFRLPDAAR